MSKKGKWLLFGKLHRELLLATLLAFLLTIVFYMVMQYLTYDSISYAITNSDYLTEKSDKSVKQFQEYVTQNRITTTDREKIQEWADRRQPLTLSIISNDRVIFDTDYIVPEDTELNDIYKDTEWYYTYHISFADKEAKIYFDGFWEYKLYSAASYFLVGLSVLLFTILFTLFIKNKIKYVTRLESEIHILESGDLGYEVEVKGCDELASLAGSLNDMRLSLASQIRAKEEAFMANRELITALSHDLRTPLTTQTGYLEILKEGHYETQEEHDRYVGKCLETCKQIKQMSDRLFEYFMAYRTQEEPVSCELEEFDAGELFLQFISENTFLLEEEGFIFQLRIPELKVKIKADTNYLCRIFDNLFSNLKKYGEKKTPVELTVQTEGRELMLIFANAVRREPNKVESTRIGLENIKSMMQQQGGRTEVNKTENWFEVKLYFPIQ